MLGSLNDFIDINELNFSKTGYQQQDQVKSPLTKYSRKRVLQQRKKRTLSVVGTYKASDKSQLFDKFTKNYPQIQELKKSSIKQQNKQEYTSRKLISERKISSFFYGQNPQKMKDQIAKEQLKRDHNLLRAIVRTKLNQEQKIANTDYEDSFNRMVIGLKNIKIKPVIEGEQNFKQQQPKSNRSLQYSIQKKSKSRLSHRSRLQFENCLNWTKKRKKDGSFYAKRLGKNDIIVTTQDKSIQNRKSMLEFIHQRSASLGI